MSNEQGTGRKFTSSAGPRQTKVVSTAASELLRVANEHVELTGVRGGQTDEFVLWAPFGGPGNPRARELFNAIGDRFAWTITSANHKEVAAALAAALPEARAARPIVDKRREPDEERKLLAEAAERSYGPTLEDGLPAGALPDSSRTCSSTGFLAQRTADGGASAPSGSFRILEGKNKRGSFFLVVLADRVERPEFERLRGSAKAAGGWYSRAFGKAPGGFGFSSEAEALAWTAAEFPAPEAPGDSPSGGYSPTDADRAPFGPAERAELDTLQAAHERGERVDFLRIGHLQTLKVRAEPEPADSPGVEPTAEVKFGDLLELARQVQGVLVEPFESGSSALVTIEGTTAPARVWDNGGEVGVRSLANWNLPDMFPLRLCSGLLDPWEVWRAVRDSIERQGRGENGRGGDAPFTLPPAPAPIVDPAFLTPAALTDCSDGLEPGTRAEESLPEQMAKVWSPVLSRQEGLAQFGARVLDILRRWKTERTGPAHALVRDHITDAASALGLVDKGAS